MAIERHHMGANEPLLWDIGQVVKMRFRDCNDSWRHVMMKVLAMKRDMTKIYTVVKRVHSFLVTTRHYSSHGGGQKTWGLLCSKEFSQNQLRGIFLIYGPFGSKEWILKSSYGVLSYITVHMFSIKRLDVLENILCTSITIMTCTQSNFLYFSCGATRHILLFHAPWHFITKY
jgi:hypothetical protein